MFTEFVFPWVFTYISAIYHTFLRKFPGGFGDIAQNQYAIDKDSIEYLIIQYMCAILNKISNSFVYI